MGYWISFKISIWLTGKNIAFWPGKNLHADQLDVIPGCTSSKRVQGCSWQTFEHDPKKWKAKKFVPKNMGLSSWGFFTCQPTKFDVYNRKLRKYYFKYLLMCNRGFTFCNGLLCSALLVISHWKDGILDLRLIPGPKISVVWDPE